MKKYPLSTPAERAIGIVFSVLMLGVFGLLLYALRDNMTMLLLTAAGVLLVVAILALYVLNVAQAVCVHDEETNTLKVYGLQSRTIDLNKVACLQTITVKTAYIESRALAFTDAEGGMVAVVPTYFTSKRGVLAEPMAKQMAAELGIEFQANVPEWMYDKEARKAHDIEVAKQEKEEAKAEREARKAMRVAKLRQKKAELQDDKKS